MLETIMQVVFSHAVNEMAYADLMDTLAERIQIILKETGLTLDALGQVAGVSLQAVHQWSTGKTKNIKNDPLFRLQRKLGYSAEWIGTGKGPKRIIAVDNPLDLLDLSGLCDTQKVVIRATVDAFEQQKNNEGVKVG